MGENVGREERAMTTTARAGKARSRREVAECLSLNRVPHRAVRKLHQQALATHDPHGTRSLATATTTIVAGEAVVGAGMRGVVGPRAIPRDHRIRAAKPKPKSSPEPDRPGIAAIEAVLWVVVV